jgi:hypothetical protein
MARLNRRHFLRAASGLIIPAAVGISRAQHISSGPIMRTMAAAAGDYNDVIDAWSARVVSNGGAAPGAGSMQALSDFWDALELASLDTKMIAVLPIVSDSLTAALTPIFPGSPVGNELWTNHSFVSGDLTVNGLLGASSKFLEPGINPTSAFADNNSSGISVYSHTASNAATVEFGYDSGGTVSFALYFGYSGTSYFDCWNTTGGRVNGANSNFAGFVTANRTSATASAIHRANSGTAFAAVVSGTGQSSIGTRPNAAPFAFALSGSGSPSSYTTRRLSFIAVHLGLSAAEAEDFYDAVQALRVALGGGYA